MQVPTISGAMFPAATHFHPTIQVTISGVGDLYYTIDGRRPCPGAPGTYRYIGPLTLDKATLLSAVAQSGTQVSEPAWGRFVKRHPSLCPPTP